MTSEQICKEFLVMNDNSNRYKNLEFVYDDTDIDYYVVINYDNDDNHVPYNTILFQMEPWIYNDDKKWGIHTWSDNWRNPDENLYLHVRRQSKYLNVAQWMFQAPKYINTNRKDKFIAFISSKLNDDGHINRVNFIKYLEEQGHDIIDIYGYKNYHNFRNYKGQIDNKSIQENYKYVFTVENNREFNYATEKIWESFISCSLAFYDGCPNLSEYVPDLSYIPIDCTEKEKTMNLMLNVIKDNLWSIRLYYIIKARDMTINKYGFFPIVHSIINDHIDKDK